MGSPGSPRPLETGTSRTQGCGRWARWGPAKHAGRWDSHNAAIVTCVRCRKDGVTLLTLRPTDALGTINNTCKESGGGGGADGVGSYGSISHTKMNPPMSPLSPSSHTCMRSVVPS
jgi:hypothetical protein